MSLPLILYYEARCQYKYTDTKQHIRIRTTLSLSFSKNQCLHLTTNFEFSKAKEEQEEEEEEGTNEGCRWNAVICNSKLIDLILIFDRQVTVALRSSGIPNHQFNS